MEHRYLLENISQIKILTSFEQNDYFHIIKMPKYFLKIHDLRKENFLRT